MGTVYFGFRLLHTELDVRCFGGTLCGVVTSAFQRLSLCLPFLAAPPTVVIIVPGRSSSTAPLLSKDWGGEYLPVARGGRAELRQVGNKAPLNRLELVSGSAWSVGGKERKEGRKFAPHSRLFLCRLLPHSRCLASPGESRPLIPTSRTLPRFREWRGCSSVIRAKKGTRKRGLDTFNRHYFVCQVVTSLCLYMSRHVSVI